MFHLVDFPSKPCFLAKEEVSCQEELFSDLLEAAFTKVRSLTGVSVLSSSTETSSSSSNCNDQCESSSGIGEEPLLGEGILDAIEEEEFLDCVSHTSHGFENEDTSAASEDEVALYSNGKCVYAHGRPAHVPPGNCVSKVSADYISFCRGDSSKARRMWEATIQWRQENDIWRIHTGPNIPFRHAKRYYPTCYHGISKSGFVVEYSFPGKMNSNALLPNEAVAEDVMQLHYYMQEYISNCLYTCDETWQQHLGRPAPRLGPETASSCGIIIVIDVKGAGPHGLTAKLLKHLKQMISISSAHYPTLAKQCLIINAPFWVAGVFATLRPLIPDDVPVQIVSEQDTPGALREHIQDDQIPEQYTGTSPYALHEHPLELRLHRFVDEMAGQSYPGDCSQDTPELMTSEHWEESEAGSVSISDTFCASEGTLERNCLPFPLHGRFRHSGEPRLRFVNESEYLVLTPQRKELDMFGLVHSFLLSIVHGFVDCNGQAKTNA